jgi:hypothetical protein
MASRIFRFHLLLCIAAASFISASARADEQWSWVQITCAPELSLFSIHRFSVIDPPQLGREAVAILQQKYGAYDSKSLKYHPLTCTIPPVPALSGTHDPIPGYTIKVLGHLDENSNATSLRMIADDAEIFLDGISLGVMGLNQYSAGIGPDWIKVTALNGIAAGFYIETCTIEDAPNPPDVDRRLTCKTTKYPPAQ